MAFFKKDLPDSQGEERLHGRFQDVQRAAELTEEGRWGEALAILDRTLLLPDDFDLAADRIDALLENPEPLRIELRDQGRLSDGQHALKSRLELGGGLLPVLMAMRGQCLVRELQAMFERHGEPHLLSQDPEFNDLVGKALYHARVTSVTLIDYPDPMAYAGLICHGCAQPEAAVKMLMHVLQLDPDHELANATLPIAQERWAAMQQ